MAGGPVALIVAGITTAVSLLVKAFNDAKERAKEAASAMRDSFNNAFEKSSEAAKKFFGRLADMQSTNKMVNSALDFGIDMDSRSKAADIKLRARNERQATADDIEKQKIAAKEKRDLALEQLKTKATNAGVDVVKATKARDLVGEQIDAKSLELVDAKKIVKDMGKVMDKQLVDEFHSLEDKVSKATRDVVKNGRESTAFMA